MALLRLVEQSFKQWPFYSFMMTAIYYIQQQVMGLIIVMVDLLFCPADFNCLASVLFQQSLGKIISNNNLLLDFTY